MYVCIHIYIYIYRYMQQHFPGAARLRREARPRVRRRLQHGPLELLKLAA